MGTMPTDPFVQGGPAQQLIEKGVLIVEQLLDMSTQEEVVNAIFALDENDLLAVTLVLVSHAHGAIAAHLEYDTRIKPPAVDSETASQRLSGPGWQPDANPERPDGTERTA